MKTIICDIDGTLLDYQHSTIPKPGHKKKHVALPGAIEKMRQWEMRGCRIVIITGRRESERERTECELKDNHIPYDMLIMGIGGGVRVVINDLKPYGDYDTAKSVNLSRDEGIKNLNI